ncbi:HK97 family phage prohead protease [Sphingobacterium sp. UT-1RO-CII-1]|uniref:HK97 family phage prohead protease n=1 Tax=Sphingobacterium sp. UT-1RO-CII-1 TaxID=2995225 RepID=UPI00227B9732|nr:HK97 family phage prohead protease [Sphingobacterium sp. UT-1RO-CII-1]MCY4779500.1 HK97 family phage prohead protease [Sphingobacterium sp. UT-1RO-CII-1]
MQGMLTKGISQGFKDVDVKQGIVTGYFAHFGSKDSDGDIIVKGAFAKSIRENGPKSARPRIKHLLDHNKKNAIAVILDLKEDDFGLYYESKAGRHNAGRDFLLMVEDGIITEHSHGYITLNEQHKSDANYIYENILLEGSSLQFWGANSNTPVTGIKSAEDIFATVAMLEKAMRNGKYTDETFIQLSERIKSLYDSLKPSDDTSEKEKPAVYTKAVLNFL